MPSGTDIITVPLAGMLCLWGEGGGEGRGGREGGREEEWDVKGGGRGWGRRGEGGGMGYEGRGEGVGLEGGAREGGRYKRELADLLHNVSMF